MFIFIRKSLVLLNGLVQNLTSCFKLLKPNFCYFYLGFSTTFAKGWIYVSLLAQKEQFTCTIDFSVL